MTRRVVYQSGLIDLASDLDTGHLFQGLMVDGSQLRGAVAYD